MKDIATEPATSEQWIRTEELIKGFCADYGLDPKYCFRVDVRLDGVTFWLYKGREGRCKGPKFVDRETGEAACEIVKFEAPW